MKQVLHSQANHRAVHRRKGGFCYVNSDLSSSLDLDLWDNILEDYLGTDSGVHSKSQSFICESALDHPRRLLSGNHSTLDYLASFPATRENSIIIESSPEKPTDLLPETTSYSSSHQRRNPGPPNFYGERRLIQQVLPLLAAIDVVDSEEKPFIAFSSNNRCQAINTIESPSAFLTPLEDIPARPTLVAETTQGSHSTTSPMYPKLA